MKVVIAPDGFGSVLGPSQVASALADGWRRRRPGDEVVVVPMSDGGRGLLDALGPSVVRQETVEVVDPRGLATTGVLGVLADGRVVAESAEACGLHLVPEGRRTPMRATTWGVGQLLDAARELGAGEVLVGLGGSATVDGGAGALSGLGLRLTVEDGSGLKVFAEDLPRVRGAAVGWRDAAWDGVVVRLLSDVRTTYRRAVADFAPQKGARPDDLPALEAGLAALRAVLVRDLGLDADLADAPGSGAAGGLGHGLLAGLPNATIESGFDVVAELVGLDDALVGADVVVTGEGRIDGTTRDGKVIAALRERAEVPVLAVTGQVVGGDPTAGDAPLLQDVERIGTEPATQDRIAAAAERLAARR